jgi:hypothetical protein
MMAIRSRPRNHSFSGSNRQVLGGNERAPVADGRVDDAVEIDRLVNLGPFQMLVAAEVPLEPILLHGGAAGDSFGNFAVMKMDGFLLDATGGLIELADRGLGLCDRILLVLECHFVLTTLARAFRRIERVVSGKGAQGVGALVDLEDASNGGIEKTPVV